jgi:hypothetical protein
MASWEKWRPLSRGLGLVLALSGGAVLTAALVRDRNAMQMLPGMDGCLTAGVLALLLPLVHGLRYRTALALALPVVVLQLAACRTAGAAFLPILGPELLAYGLLGVIPIPWHRRVEDGPDTAAEPRRSSSTLVHSSTG